MRNCKDWIESYLQYTDNSEPSFLYRKWTAISVIAACLQRKCYLQWDSKVYPNMYIILVGPSASRKGTAMRQGKQLLKHVGIPFAPDATTREALIARLKKSVASYTDDGIPKMHCSLTVYSEELTVFLGQRRLDFLSMLMDWYDCSDDWSYDTKHFGEDEVSGVWVNMLGATTPELLQTSLPLEVIEGGLASRMIFVYGTREKIVPYPVETPEEREIKKRLLLDLEQISLTYGQFTITPKCLDTYIDWYQTEESKAVIYDSRLSPYKKRRSLHLKKLAMIRSASLGNDRIIDENMLKWAISALEEVEKDMELVFAGVGKSKGADILARVKAAVLAHKQINFRDLLQIFQYDVTDKTMLANIVATLEALGFCVIDYTEKPPVIKLCK